MPEEKTDPVAAPVKDTAPVPVAEQTATTDYAPGATGVAGPGAQKMVEDTGGFISELKSLIAKYESTGVSKPKEEEEEEKEEKKEEPKATTDSKPAPVTAAAVVAPEAITATIATVDSTSKGIDSFMSDFLK